MYAHAIMALHASDWTNIAVAIASGLVALGTLVLARKTSKMAEESKESADQTKVLAEATVQQAKEVGRQAAAAEDQIRLTRFALNASVRPWLTRVTPPLPQHLAASSDLHEILVEGIEGQETGLIVSMHLRNVGAGIALIAPAGEVGGKDERLRIEGLARNGTDKVYRPGFTAAAALPPGESSLIYFIIEGADVDNDSFLSLNRNFGGFFVTVPYTDVNSGQGVVARLHVTRLGKDGPWAIKQIDYYDGEDEFGPDPIASIEFDAAVRSRYPEPPGPRVMSV
ncbi:MAG: hypothetical protein QOE83_1976 [Actinomycetota bacterium]|jgi:hypothetical protein|nr:hypothetical protein [Actinomycetota bacterium]